MSWNGVPEHPAFGKPIHYINEMITAVESNSWRFLKDDFNSESSFSPAPLKSVATKNHLSSTPQITNPLRASTSVSDAPWETYFKRLASGGSTGVLSNSNRTVELGSAGSGRDWSGELNTIMRSPCSTPLQQLSRTRAYAQWMKDFRETASSAARAVIRDRAGIQTEGGIAGGDKVLVSGLFVKVSGDLHALYGSEAASAKAAEHEARASGVILTMSDSLTIAPTACVHYRGNTLLVSARLPLQGKASLVYGSCDGGETVMDSSIEMREIMTDVGQRLNLKPHLVQGKTMHLCGDIEGHAIGFGASKAFFGVDLARVFPCEQPVAGEVGSILRRQLRPELVLNNPVPLSSDAFARWGAHDYQIHNGEVSQATIRLVNEAVKLAAMAIDGGARDISKTLHSYGVNIRYLNLVRSQCQRFASRQAILHEMVLRCAKHEIRDLLRAKAADSKYCFRTVALMLSSVVGVGAGPDTYWMYQFPAKCNALFGYFLTDPLRVNQISYDILPLKVDAKEIAAFPRFALLLQLCSVLGVVLKPETVARLLENVALLKSEEPILESDIEDIIPVVKPLRILPSLEQQIVRAILGEETPVDVSPKHVLSSLQIASMIDTLPADVLSRYLCTAAESCLLNALWNDAVKYAVRAVDVSKQLPYPTAALITANMCAARMLKKQVKHVPMKTETKKQTTQLAMRYAQDALSLAEKIDHTDILTARARCLLGKFIRSTAPPTATAFFQQSLSTLQDVFGFESASVLECLVELVKSDDDTAGPLLKQLLQVTNIQSVVSPRLLFKGRATLAAYYSNEQHLQTGMAEELIEECFAMNLDRLQLAKLMLLASKITPTGEFKTCMSHIAMLMQDNPSVMGSLFPAEFHQHFFDVLNGIDTNPKYAGLPAPYLTDYRTSSWDKLLVHMIQQRAAMYAYAPKGTYDIHSHECFRMIEFLRVGRIREVYPYDYKPTATGAVMKDGFEGSLVEWIGIQVDAAGQRGDRMTAVNLLTLIAVLGLPLSEAEFHSRIPLLLPFGNDPFEVRIGKLSYGWTPYADPLSMNAYRFPPVHTLSVSDNPDGKGGQLIHSAPATISSHEGIQGWYKGESQHFAHGFGNYQIQWSPVLPANVAYPSYGERYVDEFLRNVEQLCVWLDIPTAVVDEYGTCKIPLDLFPVICGFDLDANMGFVDVPLWYRGPDFKMTDNNRLIHTFRSAYSINLGGGFPIFVKKHNFLFARYIVDYSAKENVLLLLQTVVKARDVCVGVQRYLNSVWLEADRLAEVHFKRKGRYTGWWRPTSLRIRFLEVNYFDDGDNQQIKRMRYYEIERVEVEGDLVFVHIPERVYTLGTPSEASAKLFADKLRSVVSLFKTTVTQQ